MSSNGGIFGGGDIIIVILLLGAGFVVLATVMAALTWSIFYVAWLLTYIAFFWSLVCLMAWRRPFRLGRIYLNSDDAQAFVKRGLFGAVTLPLFLAGCDVFFDVVIRWDWLADYLVIGYTAFSVGLEILFARRTNVPYVQYEVPSAQVRLVAPKQELLLPAPKKPRFASWDDEEELRG